MQLLGAEDEVSYRHELRCIGVVHKCGYHCYRNLKASMDRDLDQNRREFWYVWKRKVITSFEKSIKR